MSGLHSRNVEYILLWNIARQKAPIGAGFLADILQGEQGEALSEATIGRYLRKFEKQGYLRSEKYEGRSRGRVITERGLTRVKELATERRQTKAVLDTLEVFSNSLDEHFHHVLATREIIEPEVAALAARNAGEEDIAAIRAIVEEAAALTRAGKSMAATDAPFHIAIAKASGNPVLEAVMKMIRTDRDYSPEIESMINASSLNNPSDHLSIYQAIANHDEEQARAIMRSHIRNLMAKAERYQRKKGGTTSTAGGGETAQSGR